MLKIFRNLNRSQDEHGQASQPNITATRVSERDIDVLIGLCQGVMADGEVTQQEAEFLLSWIESNRHIVDQWPGNILFARLQAALEDGVLDLEEQRDILELLLSIAGVKTAAGNQTSVSLPYCDPMPEILFNESTFCVTGKFACGTRKEIEGEIVSQGGQMSKNVTKRLDYLVIGELSSRDWAHKTFGRKIEKAMAYQGQDIPISIVSEEHWINQLSSCRSPWGNTDPQSLAAALSDEIERFQTIGWHVNMNEYSCGLHTFFKNGKPRKSPTISIRFDEFEIDSYYDIEADDFVEKKSKSPSPWTVWCSDTNYSSEFKSLSAAAKRFIALANARAIEE